MLLTTPEELRLFLPTHVYRNLDPVRGFLENSERSFLRLRIGQPLLDECCQQYAAIGPLVPDPATPVAPPRQAGEELPEDNPWYVLIRLCQRCIAYDGFARAADIQAVSANDMGLNIAQSENYDAASDKTIERYKSQLIKESHAASDLLLLQLEEWEKQAGTTVPEASAEEDAPSEEPTPVQTIIDLWKQSPVHEAVDGLLFNTATEFNRYIDIYDSRDRFVTLLPDIRYCQELHLAAELGPELLADIIERRRTGSFCTTTEEKTAWMMLQRSLSLYVEARAKMFSRAAAKDEATGYMNLTLAYLRRNQTKIATRDVMELSPLFEPRRWPRPDVPTVPTGTVPDGTQGEPDANHLEPSQLVHGHVRPNLHGKPVSPHCHPCDDPLWDHGNMFITPII